MSADSSDGDLRVDSTWMNMMENAVLEGDNSPANKHFKDTLDASFKAIDTNHDGKISREEWVARFGSTD